MFSFSKRKKIIDVQARMRKITNLSNPIVDAKSIFGRREDRHSRTMPALIIPFDGDTLNTRDLEMAVTHDVSETGMALIVRKTIEPITLSVSFWLHDENGPSLAPNVFVCEVRRVTDIGGGFYQLGLQIHEHVTRPDLIAGVTPWAERLLPKSLFMAEEKVAPLETTPVF